MSGATIRERIETAVDYLAEIDNVVLTTFNVNPEFVEAYALPTVLGIWGPTATHRKLELHDRLAEVPVAVFYDPATGPRFSGQFRYEARPVPMRGRHFHPKIVAISGRDDLERRWTYLGVGSANLTVDGWARNAESYGEVWIHTEKQQPWGALLEFSRWLTGVARLGDGNRSSDASWRLGNWLEGMTDLKRRPEEPDAPWSGRLRGKAYFSMVHRDGLARFIQGRRKRPPSQVVAYSPYWADVESQTRRFGADSTVLAPARRPDQRFGLAQADVAGLDAEAIEVMRNDADDGTRFWHLKAYQVDFGASAFVAVGSCNFSAAGLRGANGNAEAMLVMEDDGAWLPSLAPVDLVNLPPANDEDEGPPEPCPVMFVLAWDWAKHAWRWWLDASAGQDCFRVQVAESLDVAVSSGTVELPGEPPPRGAMFRLDYTERGEPRRWHGCVLEINLEHSARTYGRPLTASELLESWRGRAPTWDLGNGEGDVWGDGLDGEAVEGPTGIGTVNLYDLYRAVRRRSEELEAASDKPNLLRALLLTSGDSVMALVRLARAETKNSTVAYLVLRELLSMLRRWRSVAGPGVLVEVGDATEAARRTVLDNLELELTGHSDSSAQPDAVLEWFERRLAAASRRSRDEAI